MLESLLGLLDHYQLMGSNDWIYWFDMELEIGQNWNRCFGRHGHIGKFIKDIPTILYITRIPFVLTRLTLFYVYKITQKKKSSLTCITFRLESSTWSGQRFLHRFCMVTGELLMLMWRQWDLKAQRTWGGLCQWKSSSPNTHTEGGYKKQDSDKFSGRAFGLGKR